MKRKIALAMAVSMLITSIPVNSLTGLAEEAVIVEDAVVEETAEEIPETDAPELLSESHADDDGAAVPTEESGEIIVEDIEVVEDEATLNYINELGVVESLDPVVELNSDEEDTSEESAYTINLEYTDYVNGLAGTPIVLSVNSVSSDEYMITEETVITYQWYSVDYWDEENWKYVKKEISGATESSFAVEDAGNYWCKVTVDTNSWEWASFSVEIDSKLNISTASESEFSYIQPGSSMLLSVEASTISDRGLSYQWYLNSYDEETDQDISTKIEGACEPDYLVENIQSDSAYECKVNDGYNEEGTTFYIDVLEKNWYIKNGYIENEITPGTSVTLTPEIYNADGVEFTCEWAINEGYDEELDEDVYTTISDAVNLSYTTEKLSKDTTYRCIITDAAGNKEEVWFDVKMYTGLELDLSEYDCYTVYRSGSGMVKYYLSADAETVTLNIATNKDTDEDTTLSYDWKSHKEVYDEETDESTSDIKTLGTTKSVTLNAADVKTVDDIQCSVSDGYVTKEVYFFFETETTFQEEHELINVADENGNVTLNVSASTSDNRTLYYVWENDEYEKIEGENSASFTISNVTKAQKYYCRVIDVEPDTEEGAELGVNERILFVALPYGSSTNADSFENAVSAVENTEAFSYSETAYQDRYFTFTPEKSGNYRLVAHLYEEDTAGGDTSWNLNVTLYDSEKNVLKTGVQSTYGSAYSYHFCAGKQYFVQVSFVKNTQDKDGLISFETAYVGGYHKWDSGEVTKEATCGEAGERTYKCTYDGCEVTKTVKIASSDHSYPETWEVKTAATCTKAGVKYRKCTNCGAKETQEIAAAGHSFGEDQTTTTDTEVKVYKECSVCKTQKTVSITAINDLWTNTSRELWVQPGDNLTLNAEEIYTDTGLNFQWYMWDENDNYVTLDNTTSTCEVKNISRNVTYNCSVYDGANVALISYSIKVDSGLIPGEEHINLNIAKGSKFTLDPGIVVNKDTELTYLWEAYDWDDNSEIELEKNDVEKLTLTLEKSSYYFCTISDQYGNQRWVRFWISVGDPFLNLTYDSAGKYVEPGLYTTLEITDVDTNCLNPEDITYQWYSLETNDETYEAEETIIENAVSASYTTNVVGRYLCRVSLNGVTEEANFYIDYSTDPSVDYDYVPTYDLESGKTVELWVKIGEHNIQNVDEIKYQWYTSEYNEETYEYDLIEAIEGATESTYTTDKAGTYSCVATIGVVTQKMSMKVNLVVEDPYITLERVYDNQILPGEFATLKFTKIDTNIPNPDTAEYQWYTLKFDDVQEKYVEEIIDTATSSTYETNVTGQYRCKVTIGDMTESSDFSVSYSEEPYLRLSYEDEYTVELGKTLTLGFNEVSTNIQNSEIKYQWYKLGYDEDDEEVLTPISGAISSTCEVAAAGDYVCVVTIKNDAVGEIVKRAEFYVSYAEGADPEGTITLENNSYEIDVLMNSTEDIILDSKATANLGTLSYEWYKFTGYNDDDEEVYERVADEDKATLNLGVLNKQANDTYKCVVSNEYTSKTVYFYVSAGSGLKMYPQMPYRNTVKPGESITLELKAESDLSNEFEFSWYYDVSDYETGEGTVIPGAVQNGNVSTLTFTPEKSMMISYRVSDTYTYTYYGCYIYVDSGFDLVENENDWNFQGELGSSVTMEVGAVSDYPEKLTWQWYEYDEDADAGKGNPIEGANSSAYTVKVESAYKEYVCEVSDGYNTVRADCSVTPIKKLTVSAVQSVIEAAAGEEVTLKVNAATGAAYGTLKYRWENSDGDTIAENVDTITVTASEETQTYFCRVSDDYDTEKVAFAVGLQGAFDDCAMSFELAVEIKTGETKTAVILVNGASMYFKFVPEQSGCHYIYSESEDYDTYVDLYDANRNHLTDDDDGNYDYNFGLKYDFEAGKTYYIRAHFYEDYAKGSYPVTVKYEGGCVDCEWDWDNRVVTKEATCTENGEITCVCTVCGKTSVETIYSEGHAYPDEWLVENTATCTKAGTEYRACTVCGEVESRSVEATGHTYSDEITEGDDDETATVIRTYKECTVCGEEETISVTAKKSEQDLIDAAETAMSELAASTEEAVNVSGAVTAVTNMDNQTLIDIEEVSEEDAETAMKYVTDLETKLLENKNADITGSIGASAPKASTTEQPTITENVSVSGAAVTVAKALMDASESADESDVPDADSTYSAQLAVTDKTTENSEPGVYTVGISLNIIATDAEGATSTFKEDIQPAAPIYITIPVPDTFWNTEFVLKHDTGNGIVEVNYVRNDDNQTISFYAASLSDWMLDVIKCEECSYTVDADQSVEATCQSVGKTVSVCGTCGDVKITMLSKQSHAWGDWTQTKAPSCTEKGSKTHSCTNGDCNETETAEIPKLGHKFSSEYTVDKAATCTADGSKSRHCERCSETYDVQNIPASGSHSWKTVVDKAATCGAAGSQHRECTACQTKETATTIPATGSHNWTNVVDKAATCGTAGSQHKECTVCHSKQAATSIAATGQHTFGAYSVTTAPTVLSTGWEVAKCNKCTATTGRAVAKLEGTIKLSAKSLKLQIKKSVSLTSLVTGLSAGDSIKSWTVDKKGKSYVTLTSKGKVTGKKAGTAKITVTLASGKSAVITLTVQKKAVTTSKVTVANTKIKLNVGKSTTLKPIITPITSFEKATYKTSNKKVATVNSKGKVTAKAPGKATITIKVGKKSVKVTVTVPAPELKSIKLSATAKTLKKGKSFTLKVTLNPKTATNKITYSTSNKKVATVDKKGKVVAKGKGTATITVKAGKITKTCKITVK